MAPLQLNQLLADRQPQAGATEAAGNGVIGLAEMLEYPAMGVRLNSDAAVFYLESQSAEISGALQLSDA